MVNGASDASPPRRPKHDDSDDDNISMHRRSTGSRGAPDLNGPRSSDMDRDASPPRRPSSFRGRNGDDDPAPFSSRHSAKGGEKRRRDNDDEDDAAPPRRSQASPSSSFQSQIHDKTAESRFNANGTRRKVATTASGHRAGLQSGNEFGAQERTIRQGEQEQSKSMDAALSGAHSETVYRDRKGKKLDMLNEFMRQQAIREGKEVKLAKAQYEWGKGSVQKQQVEMEALELAQLAHEPFARSADDARLEAARKQAIRDGDPMAEYFASKQSQGREREDDDRGQDRGASSDIRRHTASSSTSDAKPKYKGPAPPPNRFGIPPGYRWDAVDRGNGFEHKVLVKYNDRSSLREDEYRWSVADM